jgi:hypothetical protein
VLCSDGGIRSMDFAAIQRALPREKR